MDESSGATPALGISKKLQMLITIALLSVLIAIVAFLLYYKLLARDTTLTSMLPKNDTLIFLEVDNYRTLPSMIGSNFETLEFLKQQFNISDLDDTWMSGKLAFALINHEDGLEPILAVEMIEKEQGMEFMEKLAVTFSDLVISDNYKGQKIYSYESILPYYYILAGDYLVLGMNQNILKKMIDVSQSDGEELDQSPAYQRVHQNLPEAHISVYFDTREILKTRNGWWHLLSGYSDLVKLWQFGGLNISQKSNGLDFELLALADKSALVSEDVSVNSKKFEARLAEIIPGTQAAIYLGGVDLEGQFLTTQAMLQELNPAFSVIIEGILAAQIEKYMGPDIALHPDILPLLSNEYALTLGLNFGQPALNLYLESADPQQDTARLKKLRIALQDLAASLMPKIESITLPDGTSVDEIVADEEAVKMIDENYRGVNIQGMTVRGTPYGFVYGISDNTLLISSAISALQVSVDSILDFQNTLAQDPKFSQLNSDIRLDSDEIGYIDFSAFGGLIDRVWNDTLKSFLSKYRAMLWKKKGFADGVSLQGGVR